MLHTFREVAWVLELQKQPGHAVACLCWDVSRAQGVGTLALISCCHAQLWSVLTMLAPAHLSASLCRQPPCCLGNTSSVTARCRAWARGCSTLPAHYMPPHSTRLRRQPPEQGVPCRGPNPEGALLRARMLASRSCSGRITKGCRYPTGITEQDMGTGGCGACFG